MTVKIIITKYLTREFTDDSPAIYLYACGGKRSQQTAIEKVFEHVEEVFVGATSENNMLSIIRDFLESKRKAYWKGEITVIPLYGNGQPQRSFNFLK